MSFIDRHRDTSPRPVIGVMPRNSATRYCAARVPNVMKP